MRAWLLLTPFRAPASRVFGRRVLRCRSFSTASHERVQVRCGSAGSVSIDLFNMADQPSTSTVFIHLPSFPSPDETPATLPNFLQGKPVATINYRWNSKIEASEDVIDPPSSLWPTPVHDTSFAYTWLLENFTPDGVQRRDIYVYGSYLGASLATSLALTQTHPHMRFAVRGGIVYNGIYNWTMFLPDHPINRPTKSRKATTTGGYLRPEEGTRLSWLQDTLPDMFPTPAELFDPFASPSLFFHNPGLSVPSSFSMSVAQTAALEAIMNPETSPDMALKTPRKSHLVFPPRQSTLKIPEMLILHDAPAAPPLTKTGRKSRATVKGNTYGSQAGELVELMRRSIDKVELKERSKWDDEVDSWDKEMERRVQMVNVGEETTSRQLSQDGEDAIQDWLAERVRARTGASTENGVEMDMYGYIGG